MQLGEGFDGAAAWEQTVGGEVLTPDAPEAVARATTVRWLTARGYFRAGGAGYRELGARTCGDRACHAVEATPVGGAAVELWFDDATGLLARTVHHEGTLTIVTTFDDYRAVDGVQLPFRTVVDPGDPRNRATVTVTEVHLRAPPGEAAYARPRTDAERLSFVNGARDTRLPFELINNHIYIRAQIDGQPVRMLVDTGGLNLLTPAAAARLGLAASGKLAASGVGERKVDMALARGRELAVGDVRLAEPVFYVIEIEGLSDIEGEAFDGLVGFELFHRLAARIDYPQRSLTLTRRDAFVPPTGAITVPFDLRDRTPIASGSIDGIPARLTIDTGSRASLTVNSPFTRNHGLEARYHPAFEAVTGWGVGGPTRAKPVRLKQVKLGDAVISDVAGELFTGDKGAFADPESSANLGGGILRRFAVTFDYRDRKMFLEPEAGVPRDVYDRAGMFLRRAGDALGVLSVVPGGPAARAGIAVGDRIVAIDGAPASSRSLAAWRAVLSGGEIGGRRALTVEAGAPGGPRRECTLVLAELLP
jgi:predicted aspartyl protease